MDDTMHFEKVAGSGTSISQTYGIWVFPLVLLSLDGKQHGGRSSLLTMFMKGAFLWLIDVGV